MVVTLPASRLLQQSLRRRSSCPAHLLSQALKGQGVAAGVGLGHNLVSLQAGSSASDGGHVRAGQAAPSSAEQRPPSPPAAAASSMLPADFALTQDWGSWFRLDLQASVHSWPAGACGERSWRGARMSAALNRRHLAAAAACAAAAAAVAPGAASGPEGSGTSHNCPRDC